MAELELKNTSEYEFVDISTEEYRDYHFRDLFGVVRIVEPQWLAVSKSGHRILTKDGISHYIPNGWYHLEWKAKKDCPHFVK